MWILSLSYIPLILQQSAIEYVDKINSEKAKYEPNFRETYQHDFSQMINCGCVISGYSSTKSDCSLQKSTQPVKGRKAGSVNDLMGPNMSTHTQLLRLQQNIPCLQQLWLSRFSKYLCMGGNLSSSPESYSDYRESYIQILKVKVILCLVLFYLFIIGL